MDPMTDGLRGMTVGLDGQGNVASNTPMMPFGFNGQGQPNFQGMQYQQQQAPADGPHGIPNPSNRSADGNSGGFGDQSSMASFQKKWFNATQDDGNGQGNQFQQTPNGQQSNGQQPNGQQPQQEPTFNLAEMQPDAFTQYASQLDFMKGVPQEVMAKFKPDENGQVPQLIEGMMELMQHATRNAYAHSLAGSSRLAARGMSDLSKSFEGKVPQVMVRQAASAAMERLGIPEMIAPAAEKLVDRYLSSKPNASPESIQELLSDFMESMGMGASQQQKSRGGKQDLLGNLFD